MLKPLRNAMFLLFLPLAPTLAHAQLSPESRALFSSKVIYGVDNRLDYFETTDPVARQWADSTVALVQATALTANGNTTDVVSVSYGQSYGLCKTERFYAEESAAFCSGFLVTPDTVVTAGHCITQAASCARTRFLFDFKLKSANQLPHSIPTALIFACKSVVHSVSVPTGEDFAVVKLDRPVTHVSPLRLRTTGSPAVDDSLMVIGYPAGLPVKIAGGANVRSVQAQFLVANTDTYGGNSGSAIINTQTGLVEGVLVRGETDFEANNGCNISKVCPSAGCRGEDVTLISRVLPFLN